MLGVHGYFPLGFVADCGTGLIGPASCRLPTSRPASQTPCLHVADIPPLYQFDRTYRIDVIADFQAEWTN